MGSKFLRAAVTSIAVLGITLAACSSDDTSSTGSATLNEVTDRGVLNCGVKDSQPGFGFMNPDGVMEGNDVEYCKAIAAAVLGDASKVNFVPASAKARFDILAAKEIDVLIRTTTWTASRDINLKTTFAHTTFYDGQGMMVKSASKFAETADLNGATICVTTGTTTEQNLEDFFADRGLSYTALAVENDAESQAAFLQDRCDGWTGDKSNLAGQRSAYPAEGGGSAALRILPDTLSKEPLGPVTREDDPLWSQIVDWVVLGTILAEEFGVDSTNVAAQASSPKNKDVSRLLCAGAEPTEFNLGISCDFMQNVIAQVGNFGEIYARTIEPIGLAREGSLNASWKNGGLIYAPPMR
ncbi:MAG: amino acid ABC transporter substrate-binding protein [Chloroflexi bacterium]|nr:amino acid ABC transporter substrate-binding protein [Chloroflexota bacterium]|tara:strand:+ start:304 stop:1365 length:1062 start_codon:yes stop_codon:yes gene_type:complete